jgi:hypothetical protein
MCMVIEHVREDHGIPDCEGYLQRFPGSLFRRFARKIMNYGLCEVQEGLGDFSVRETALQCVWSSRPPASELLF